MEFVAHRIGDKRVQRYIRRFLKAGIQGDLRALKGRLDLSKVGVVGHSFGASTAIATLASGDKRFRLAIITDVHRMLCWEFELRKERSINNTSNFGDQNSGWMTKFQ